MFVLRIIWASLLSTVAIYGMVGYFTITPSMVAPVPGASPVPGVESKTPPLDPEKLRLLVMGFGVLSTIVGAGSLVVRRRLCTKEIALRYLEARPLGAPTTESLKDAQAEGGTPLEVAAAQAFFPGYIISWGLADAVAIHGFTLSQLIHKPSFYFWFGVPAIILFILNRPTTENIDAAVSEYNAPH